MNSPHASRRLSRSSALLVLLTLAAPVAVRSAETLQSGSRTPHHHVIPLRDADGNMITPPPEFDEQGKPQEARGLPFSMAQTCGKCHEYPTISQGWHFNAGSTNIPSGRPGEPWVLTDPATRTQIPLSYRGWSGTYRPAEVGLNDYDFLLAFGRHFPGGGVGEPPKERIGTHDVRMRRMQITGPLEIDCLLCHTRHGEYDHEARVKALTAENFKWAPTIGSEVGVYGASRTAKAFADAWRPPRPAPTNLPPVRYNRDRFDSGNHVTFDVTRRPPSENCYFCHTSESHVGDKTWHSDRDVHIRAGMLCVDCHRNGIDHMVVRGYEGEIDERPVTADMIGVRTKVLLRDDPTLDDAGARKLAESQLRDELGQVETLTCRGCHYGTETSPQPGRLGAPFPVHKGIPPVHFERLACTACHSGPVPKDATEIVQTSLAHKLGIPAPVRGANTAPIIVQPAFLRDARGKIAPHKMVWPSYWAYWKDEKAKPLLPEEITRIAGDSLPKQSSDDVERDPYNTKPLTDAQIKEVLGAMAKNSTNGEPIFVAAGKRFRLQGDALQSEEHPIAKPYAWALAHDVRPASQSVGAGAKGCADCHSEDSPIYFATVAARGPVDPKEGLSRTQAELRGDDTTVASTFAFTFRFRPFLKILTFGCAVIILGALVGQGIFWLRGGRTVSGRNPR